ncbi:putative lipid II flippase FtsW [candidate division KSB3 bacterium]|uniref:Probable peptidoglycan glycosyltransferase FtsW n=1 Tax=candidate division KSB3 bacterium TaxID=2044937 RepID=A0A2G6E548_9BACT|nr:MAG: putative lipid II flippase FtsW [candidate division KSB3 bacterium]PIE29793.1 MAG: putative lipid II flippase FtsW [candidate division KSB3 bacterium]
MSPASDKIFLAIVLILVAFGIVMVYSTSGIHGEFEGNSHHFLLKHVFSILLGLLAMTLASLIPYTFYRRPPVILFLLFLAFTLLILTLLPGVGMKINHARRWLPLGTFRTFQASELAKLIAVLYFSYYMVKKQDKINSFTFTVLPSLIILSTFFCLIILQPDLGTAINIVALVLPLMFIAGVRLGHLLGVAAVVLPVLSLLAWTRPYTRSRIMMFSNPWQDPQGAGYQLIQSLIAIGKGGLTGVGLGRGQQKLFYLPEPYSDFIFSTVGEELGFLGAVVMIVLFGMLVWRGFTIACNAPDLFATFVAFGLTMLIAVQAIVNLGVVTGIFPTKGLPLPFISHGGTSLIVCLAGSGILLNISKSCAEHSRHQRPRAVKRFRS